MEYGRLGRYQPGKNRPDAPLTPNNYDTHTHTHSTNSTSKIKLLIVFAFTLIVVSAVSVGVVIHFGIGVKHSGAGPQSVVHPRPTEAMSRVCGRTRFQNLCLNSLLKFPGSLSASDKDMIHISMNMTLQRVGKALYTTEEISNLNMDTRVRSAYEDCLELLEDSVDQLSRSLFSVAPSSDGGRNVQHVGSSQDVMTWLSAALTNQDTCTDGLSEVEDGYVKKQMDEKLKDLSEMVSNCLAIYAAASDGDDFNGVPIQHRRRRLMSFPKWLGQKERMLLQMPVAGIQADIVVSKDGNGTCTTIGEAIKKAPEHSSRRIIIYVRAGR